MAAVSHGASAPAVRYNFNAVPLACYEHEGDLWMLGEDVGSALEYANPRIAINKLYVRNKLELDRYSMMMMLDTGNWVPEGGFEEQKRGAADPNLGTQVPENDLEEGAEAPSQRRRIRVFNEEGVMILTMLSNQPKAAEFRAWAVKILKAYRHGELALTQPASRENLLITCIKEARFGNPVALHTLIERYGYPETIRREVKSDLYRRAMRDQAQAPELVDWFIDNFLPALREEIEGAPGRFLGAIRNRAPGNYSWKEIEEPGAIWCLRHRQCDLYGFVVPLAEQDEVDIDVSSNRFTRWLTYSAGRIKARGWERREGKRAKGMDVYKLTLIGEVSHG